MTTTQTPQTPTTTVVVPLPVPEDLAGPVPDVPAALAALAGLEAELAGLDEQHTVAATRSDAAGMLRTRERRVELQASVHAARVTLVRAKIVQAEAEQEAAYARMRAANEVFAAQAAAYTELQKQAQVAHVAAELAHHEAVSAHGQATDTRIMVQLRDELAAAIAAAAAH